MTANIRVRRSFARPADALVAALRDRDFHDEKVRFVGAPGSHLKALDDHPVADSQVNVVVEQRVLRSELPGIARRFAGGDLRARREEWWDLSPIYSTGEFEVKVAGAPMRAGGTMSVLGSDEGCRLSVRAFISVSALLVGRSIERAMAECLHDWLDDEYEFTRRWLDENS